MPRRVPLAVAARRFAGFAVATLVAAAPCAGAAAIVVSAERQGEAIELHASAALLADADMAWRVLTDYERYPDFIPDLRTSRVVARRGTTVIVEQSGNAWVWLLPIPLHITFEIVESPPRGLHSQAIAGSLRALQSSYVIAPSGPGVRLDYSGQVTPGFGFFGVIELKAVEQNVARQFQALADEIERRSAAEGAHAAPADPRVGAGDRRR